jgi:hypothetical protein
MQGMTNAAKKQETPRKISDGTANKKIPSQYAPAIRIALSHYPELANTHIEFRLVEKASAPYGTKPSFSSPLNPRNKRKYLISILENTDGPMGKVLMKNLPLNLQVGVIGHELAHVVQYNSKSGAGLVRLMALYVLPKYKRKIERAADICTVSHGLGGQLLEHAEYIRQVPGYVQERPEIDENYLLPDEIREYLSWLNRRQLKKASRKKTVLRKGRAAEKRKPGPSATTRKKDTSRKSPR